MDHEHFKAKQTAALYIADGLNEHAQEAFELHLMSCLECVEDVEMWRALKDNMPLAQPATARPIARYSIQGWRVAASFVIGIVGAAGGWYLHSIQGAPLHDEGTAFFNLPPLTRSVGNCSRLPLATDTEVVAVRVPSVGPDLRIVAVDSTGRELQDNRYAATVQADGSWIVRLQAKALDGQLVGLEARDSLEPGETLGCITGADSTSQADPALYRARSQPVIE